MLCPSDGMLINMLYVSSIRDALQVTKHLDGLLRKYRVGLCNVFLQHTSASLTINEVSATPAHGRMSLGKALLSTQSTGKDELLTMPLMRQNADPDVRHDMETFLNTTVPEVRSGSLLYCCTMGPQKAYSDAAWLWKSLPNEMSISDHGATHLMSSHRHSLQGRKAPWIHTAEGDDDMPGASDDCTVITVPL